MAPGFVPAVGDRVDVKAWKGAWYGGKAVATRVKAGRTELRIQVDGFGTRFPLWLPQGSSDLRRPVSAVDLRRQQAQAAYNTTTGYDASKNTWTVDRIIAKKRTEKGWRWRVRWEGFPQSEDTWEPRHHAPELIEEFEEEQARRVAKKAAHAKKPPAPPAEPYSTGIDDEPSAQFAIKQIAAQATKTLRSAIAKQPRHKLRVARIAGAPWIFRGVRALMLEKASDLANAEDLVTQIKAAPGSRGQRVVDEFSFNDPELGNRLLEYANRDDRGEGAVYVRPQGGNVAALLPQWRFTFRTKRAPNAEEVIDVHADLGQLVAATTGNPEPYFAFASHPKDPTGKTRLYSEEEEEGFSLSIAAALQRLEARVGAHTVAQLPWLHTQAFV